MKALALVLAALAVVVLSGGTARAHPIDGFGAPDPYWQSAGVTTVNADASGAGATNAGAQGAARLVQGLVYASGGLALLLLLSLVRLFRGSRERSWD